MNESTISGHLNGLVKSGILSVEREANLKKFYVENVPEIFPIFDSEKLNSLSSKDKNSIKDYLDSLEIKPVILLVSIDNNKIELISVGDNREYNYSVNRKDNEKLGWGKRGNEVKFKITKIKEKELKKELSARKQAFPVFNAKYFYEVVYND